MADKGAIKHVVCCGCSLLCDDIVVTVNGSRILNVRNACIIGEQRFRIPESKSRISVPLVRSKKNREVKETSLDEAIKKAAEILLESKRPLFYGWGSTTCEAQKVGIQLAEKSGGIIAGPFSSHDKEILRIIKEEGYSSCTLGQIKNRADLIIFWNCNPFDSHPRLLSRYAVFPAGFFNQGRPDRKIIVINHRETEISKIADKTLNVKPHLKSLFLSTLELAFEKQESIRTDQTKWVDIQNLAGEIKNSNFGALFFEIGSALDCKKLFSFIKKLNIKRKFILMELKRSFNVKGFMMTMLRETGHPLGADFSGKYSDFNEIVASEIIEHQECDSMLVIGADPASNLPWRAAKQLGKIPLVVIDPYWTPTVEMADVVIPAAISGIEADGTAYRMDGVPLYLKKVINPPKNCLPDEQILRRLLEVFHKKDG